MPERIIRLLPLLTLLVAMAVAWTTADIRAQGLERDKLEVSRYVSDSINRYWREDRLFTLLVEVRAGQESTNKRLQRIERGMCRAGIAGVEC